MIVTTATIRPNKADPPTASTDKAGAVGGAAVPDKTGEVFVAFRKEAAKPPYDGPPPAYPGHEAPPPYDGPPPAYPGHEAPPPYDGPPPAYTEKATSSNRPEDNFFVELKREYGEEVFDYVNRRFAYHYQKPPDYNPTKTDKKLLEAALHNYQLTDKVVEKVAKEYGQDNAWQGLFEVTEDSDGSFDGIFTEKLDEAKLLKRVRTAAAQLRDEPVNAPNEDEQPTALGSFHLPAWTPHGGQSIGTGNKMRTEQAGREVKVVRAKPENLPSVMERIYRSHLRTMRLFNSAAVTIGTTPRAKQKSADRNRDEKRDAAGRRTSPAAIGSLEAISANKPLPDK